MDKFYFIVGIVAIVILILALTFIGLLMRSTKKTIVFPSSLSNCPDLWIPDGSNNYCYFNGANNGTYDVSNNKLKNDSFVKNTDKYSYIDLKSNVWSKNGTTEICGKNNWANQYNVQWTGIKEYNNC